MADGPPPPPTSTQAATTRSVPHANTPVDVHAYATNPHRFHQRAGELCDTPSSY